VAIKSRVLHLEHPESAIREAWRVLKEGGRYSYATWCGPDQGGEYFGLLMGAIRKHGTLNVPLPPVPPAFKYADENEAHTALTNAGFRTLRTKKILLTWHPSGPEEIFELLYKSIVRLTLVLETQTEEARARIHEEVLDRAGKYRVNDRLNFTFPVVLATAEKRNP